MAIRKFSVTVTTVTATGEGFTPYLSGYIQSVQYVKDDFSDGVDFTITSEATGEAIWVDTDVNASETVRPRAATCTTAGVASLYAADGTAVNDRIALGRDRVKIAVAQGGNGTSGTFIVTIDDAR